MNTQDAERRFLTREISDRDETIKTLQDELIEAQQNKFTYLEAVLIGAVCFISGVWSCCVIS